MVNNIWRNRVGSNLGIFEVFWLNGRTIQESWKKKCYYAKNITLVDFFLTFQHINNPFCCFSIILKSMYVRTTKNYHHLYIQKILYGTYRKYVRITYMTYFHKWTHLYQASMHTDYNRIDNARNYHLPYYAHKCTCKSAMKNFFNFLFQFQFKYFMD